MKFTRNNNITVEKVMMPLESFPIVEPKFLLKKVITGMSTFGIGVACVVDKKKRLIGIFTDGDLRRKIIKMQKPLSAFFNDDIFLHMNKNPVTVNMQDNVQNALSTMQKLKIWDVPVVNKNKILIGLLHLHPAVNQILKVEK